MKKFSLVLLSILIIISSACGQDKPNGQLNVSGQKDKEQKRADSMEISTQDAEKFEFKDYIFKLSAEDGNCFLVYQRKDIENRLKLALAAPCKFVRGGTNNISSDKVRISNLEYLKANVFTVGGEITKNEDMCQYGDNETASFFQVVLIKENEIKLGGTHPATNCLNEGLSGAEFYLAAEKAEEKP